MHAVCTQVRISLGAGTTRAADPEAELGSDLSGMLKWIELSSDLGNLELYIARMFTMPREFADASYHGGHQGS